VLDKNFDGIVNTNLGCDWSGEVTHLKRRRRGVLVGHRYRCRWIRL